MDGTGKNYNINSIDHRKNRINSLNFENKFIW